MKIALPSFFFVYLLWLLIRKRYLAWPTPPPGASIFITGTDSGMGRITALYLNSMGYHIFCGVLNEINGNSLKVIAKYPELMTPIVCDVTNIEQVQKAAAVCSKATNGKLWGLVNNAGIFACDGPVEFLSQERVERTININLWGVWNVTRAFLPMIRASKGRIVNIASICGFYCWMGNAAYCISKHGVEALTDCLRMDVNPLGCVVSVIEPGFIKTPLLTTGTKIVDDCWNEMGPKCWQVYGKKKIVPEDEKKFLSAASSPDLIAKTIKHALCSPYPKLRYCLGSSATFVKMAKEFLPDRILHLFTSRGSMLSMEPWVPQSVE